MSDFTDRLREFYRLFAHKAREGREAATEAIEQRAAIQRFAGRIKQLDRERADLMRQIGTKVYSLHTRSKVRNQDILGDCTRVDAILAEITGLKKDIEQIRLSSLDKELDIPALADDSELTVEAGSPPAPAQVQPSAPAEEPSEEPPVAEEAAEEPDTADEEEDEEEPEVEIEFTVEEAVQEPEKDAEEWTVEVPAQEQAAEDDAPALEEEEGGAEDDESATEDKSGV